MCGAGFYLPKPLPFLFRAGLRAAVPGAGTAPVESGYGATYPQLGQPVAGRNRALCSPVKAAAVPELREEVSITQNKSLFFDYPLLYQQHLL